MRFCVQTAGKRLKSLSSLFEQKPDDTDAYDPGICPQIHKEETYGTGVSGHHKTKRSPEGGEKAPEKVSSLSGSGGRVQHLASQAHVCGISNYNFHIPFTLVGVNFLLCADFIVW